MHELSFSLKKYVHLRQQIEHIDSLLGDFIGISGVRRQRKKSRDRAREKKPQLPRRTPSLIIPRDERPLIDLPRANEALICIQSANFTGTPTGDYAAISRPNPLHSIDEYGLHHLYTYRHKSNVTNCLIDNDPCHRLWYTYVRVRRQVGTVSSLVS